MNYLEGLRQRVAGAAAADDVGVGVTADVDLIVLGGLHGFFGVGLCSSPDLFQRWHRKR